MLISYRWLQRHVDLDGVSPERVCELFTMHTAEVEGLEPFAPVLSDVVVGHVVEREKHPDADKLSVCKVDVGAEAPLQIVCGAPNVDAGLHVAVARVGTRLPGDIKIKKGKIRGQESVGMICSERELGLGEEHSGIWELPGSPPVGEPVGAACGIQDWIIEIDNKSLTHRPDLWGHRGLAGELAALLGRELKPIATELPPQGEAAPLPVRVEHEHCSRYLGLTLAGVPNGRSPEWMRLLLLAVGQRPLDLLVDVSNFVMLDLGQPNHLFDKRTLSSEGIVVRKANPGETMTTLDESERKLDPADLLICDGARPVALAGVMGGAETKVEGETDELFLELACFDPTCVRLTSARLGLRTDASTRYEKHLDPTLIDKTAAHLVSILAELAPNLSLPAPPAEDGRWTDPAHSLSLRPERVRAVLGHPVADERIQSILESLGFGVRAEGAAWEVRVPSARSTKDVTIEEDLIEEIGRVIGYGEIEERPLEGALLPAPRDPRRALVRRLQDALSGGARFHEVQTYSFLHDDLVARLGLEEEPAVRVLHPVSDGLARVRRSVLPSLIGLLADNLRHRESVCLYEIGKGYLPERSDERGQPEERHELALAFAAPAPAEGARFDADALGELRGVLADLCGSLRLDAPVS